MSNSVFLNDRVASIDKSEHKKITRIANRENSMRRKYHKSSPVIIYSSLDISEESFKSQPNITVKQIETND